MENECLHKEVDRLQYLLSSKGTPLTQPIIKRHLSLEEKVVQNIAEYRSPLVSKSLPVKPIIFVSFLSSMGKKKRYVFLNATFIVFFMKSSKNAFF